MLHGCATILLPLPQCVADVPLHLSRGLPLFPTPPPLTRGVPSTPNPLCRTHPRRLDSPQRLRHVLQEHSVHLRRRLLGYVLPVAHDGAAGGHRQAVLLVLQAWRLRAPRVFHGHPRKHPRPQFADRVM